MIRPLHRIRHLDVLPLRVLCHAGGTGRARPRPARGRGAVAKEFRQGAIS